MKYTSIVASCLIGAALGQTWSSSLLCVDDTSASFPITGTYEYYDDENDFSIWIQNSSDEAYIIYFEESLGNMYQAWGLWKCDQAYYYTDYADESSDKYPGNKDGCSGDPVVFCPALGEDDLSIFGIDGQDDQVYTWLPDAFPHPYNCSHWYEYANDATYFTSKTVDYIHGYVCEDDDTNDNSNDNVVAPGERDSIGSDSSSSKGMSSGAKSVLWIILSIFIVGCVAAACYFAYHWRQKHLAETGAGLEVGFQPPVEAVASNSMAATNDGVALETGA